jgi:hypothetical protein
MEEKELINKIKELREIKPSQDWVVCTRVRILGIEEKKGLSSVLEFMPRLVLKYNKLAFAVVIVFGFVTGTFTLAQNSLPGDPMYALKRATEKVKTVLASDQELPKVQLQLAYKRLEELDKIAKMNRTNNLAQAIQEFQADISKAAEGVANAKNPDVKEIASETKKIKESKENIEALGVAVGDTKDLDNALVQLIERELKDLEVRTLSDDQKKVFDKATEDFKAGNYSEALEGILIISNQK